MTMQDVDNNMDVQNQSTINCRQANRNENRQNTIVRINQNENKQFLQQNIVKHDHENNDKPEALKNIYAQRVNKNNHIKKEEPKENKEAPVDICN